jgi:DNA-3-methyladenine glycosylase
VIRKAASAVVSRCTALAAVQRDADSRSSRVPRSSVLPQSFYARETLVVARELLGKLLRHDEVVLRISEVEAYCYPDDSASHCRFGMTARNAPMWGPAGHAYVYLCYGIHQMLNIVTNRASEGAAVLIRSCEPVAGLQTIEARRGGLSGPVSLTGPGKVGAALALDATFSGQPLFHRRGLHLLDAPAPAEILVGPRVGIGYALPAHQEAPWRFALAGSAWVSQRKSLHLETRR